MEKGLAEVKSQVLSSEWKTERVSGDESGDSENGEDDKLSCVTCVGENEGVCIWQTVCLIHIPHAVSLPHSQKKA